MDGEDAQIPRTKARARVWRCLRLGVVTLWNDGGGRSGAATNYVVDFWLIVTLLTLVCGAYWAMRWSRRRNILPGHCATCGYDMRATPDRCPECGTIAPAAASFT